MSAVDGLVRATVRHAAELRSLARDMEARVESAIITLEATADELGIDLEPGAELEPGVEPEPGAEPEAERRCAIAGCREVAAVGTTCVGHTSNLCAGCDCVPCACDLCGCGRVAVTDGGWCSDGGCHFADVDHPDGLDRADLDRAIEMVVSALGAHGHEDLARVLAVATDPDGPDPEVVAELRRRYGLHDLSETPRALALGRELLAIGREIPTALRAACFGVERSTRNTRIVALLAAACDDERKAVV